MSRAAGKRTLAILATLAITFLVPFPVYGAFEALGWVELPQGGPAWQFVLGVLVIKIGSAVGFVLLWELARSSLRGSWWRYAGLWWLMFAVIEAGQAIGPGYSVAEAVAGVLSEAVYFPLAGAMVARLLPG